VCACGAKRHKQPDIYFRGERGDEISLHLIAAEDEGMSSFGVCQL